MERNTILAIVLSIAVMLGYFMLQGILFPQPPQELPDETRTQTQSDVPLAPVPVADGQTRQVETQIAPEQSPGETPELPEEDISAFYAIEPEIIEIGNNLVRAVFTNLGGNMISYQLLEHYDAEMILRGIDEPEAFSVKFSNLQNILNRRTLSPETYYFNVRKPSDISVEFYRDFEIPGEGEFTLTKRYDFFPNEYMFRLTITMDGGNSINSFNYDEGIAYTLSFGPQIGPKFEKLDQRNEFRQYLTVNNRNNKVKQEKTGTIIREVPEWAAIAGKYFLFLAIPRINQFDLSFSEMYEEGLSDTSRMFISRPAYRGSWLEDEYYFYLGPKKQDILETYYTGRHNTTLPNHTYRLAGAAKTKTLLSIPPLENLLKLILDTLYKIIPNYGVAIIILTVIVKLALFPLTKKGSEATMRMQTLAPKIKEIQEKYQNNKQKMNQEMAEFYKKEGYNPLSGCLPMLIQLPIFFAMFNLFNNHFDLRGANFIPGWIPDLSAPEFIYEFKNAIPLTGWTALRLLPFIYVGSQLLYGKVTQTPDQRSNKQMKFMLYIMPLIFFFILYDMPSGLLIYWIMSNILTMVQQVAIAKFIRNKKAAAAITEGEKTVIAPPKKSKPKRS